MEIIDDVLEPEVLDNIVQNMTSSRFLWEYQPYLKGPEGDDDKGIYCFTHKYVYNRGEGYTKEIQKIYDSFNCFDRSDHIRQK